VLRRRDTRLRPVLDPAFKIDWTSSYNSCSPNALGQVRPPSKTLLVCGAPFAFISCRGTAEFRAPAGQKAISAARQADSIRLYHQPEIGNDEAQ
jgi:hypothetical protein